MDNLGSHSRKTYLQTGDGDLNIDERLTEAYHQLEELGKDMDLIQEAWTRKMPAINTIFKTVNEYLVPYYKCKGCCQILKIIKSGKVDVEDPSSIQLSINSLKQEEFEKGKLAEVFRLMLETRGAVEYHELCSEISWYVKPFYELVGARDTLESFLDSVTV